nr:RNA-directed DNA polymerase, eukaryota, reverse transcriptase zinc-binding domain protein [Tanacetum cinerariifolium]
ADVDRVIDKGEGSDADGHRRQEVVRLIQEVKKVDAMEVAQKLKLNGPSRVTRTRSIIMNDDLEKEVSNEEIKRVVWDCGIDKAPGPDGFTFGFYRRYWDIIGNNVVDVVKWFFCMERSRKEVLANRLVTVLDDIVDEIQYTFVTDRQILDDPFILNEIVHWCKNKKKQYDFQAWCGDIAFKNLVPRLRNPRGGVEQAQFERLKEMVEGVTLSNSNDKLSWSLVSSGDFSVSSVRKFIDNAILPKGISKTRWIKKHHDQRFLFVGHLRAQDQLERLRVDHDGLVSKFEESKKICKFMKIMIASMVVVFMVMKM